MAVLLLLMTVGAFAQTQSWARSYNKDGQLNFYASVGYVDAITIAPGAEYIFGQFQLGGIPFDFGIMGRLYIAIASAGGETAVGWGIAPLATLHMGLTAVPIEFFIGAGVIIAGVEGESYLDFAGLLGAIYHLNSTFGILLEVGYAGGFVWGAGIEVQL